MQVRVHLLRPETVHRILPKNHGAKQAESKKSGTDEECRCCGRMHLKKEECPAWGKTCSLCKRKNNFAVKCTKRPSAPTKPRYKSVSQLTTNDSDDDEWINIMLIDGD